MVVYFQSANAEALSTSAFQGRRMEENNISYGQRPRERFVCECVCGLVVFTLSVCIFVCACVVCIPWGALSGWFNTSSR